MTRWSPVSAGLELFLDAKGNPTQPPRSLE